MGLFDFLGKIFDPGKGARQDAGRIVDDPRSQIIGGGAGVPALNLESSFNFDQWGQPYGTTNLGMFGPVAWGLLNQATNNLGQPATNLDFLTHLFSQQVGQTPRFDPVYGTINPNAELLAGMQSLFGSSLGTAGASPFALGSQATKALQAGALPEQKRATFSAMDRLFQKGRLGSTGGANVMGRLAEAQQKEDLDFQVAGFNLGRGMKQDALSALQAAFAGSESLLGRVFNQHLANQNLGLAAAGLGGDLFSRLMQGGIGLGDLLMQNRIMGQNMNIQGIGSAAGLAQLGIPFQELMLRAATAQSNANLARAGAFQQQAAQTPSPVLGGIDALGSFFQPIDLNEIF